MKTKTMRFIASGAVLAGGAWCWWLLGMRADGERGSVRVRTAAAQQQPPLAANTIKETAVQWPEYGGPAFKRMARERSEEWLNARGRDAAGLIAVWDLTGDEALLKEAAERFPHDPVVCMAMIGRLQSKPLELEPWVERLIAAEPKNPAGYHFRAWVLRGKRDAEGALAALTEAGKLAGARNNHAVDRARTVREAGLAAGMTPALAARAAVGTPFDRMLDCRLGGSVNRVILDEAEKMKKEGNEARLMEITGLGLTISESLKKGTATGERFAGELETALLKGLPGDTEIGPGGRSAGSLRAEVDEQMLYVRQAHRHGVTAGDRMRTGTEEWVVTYADCFLSHGEVTATISMLDLPDPEDEEKGR